MSDVALVRMNGAPGSSGGFVRCCFVLTDIQLREAENRIAGHLKFKRAGV